MKIVILIYLLVVFRVNLPMAHISGGWGVQENYDDFWWSLCVT